MTSLPFPNLGALISVLPEITTYHARHNPVYQYLDQVAKATVASSHLTDPEGKPENLGPFGELNFPFTEMGAINSLDLFGIDELIIFAFYWRNRMRYRHAGDIGGNLGLHSLLMSRCGWTVRTFEPDPRHANWLRRNLQLNGVTSVDLHEAAVSNQPGTLEFIRVLGNTTSSHLAGSKNNAYGELERFPVAVESISSVVTGLDFLKVDAEGQEKNIVLGISREVWKNLDMMVEIGTTENAEGVYEFVRETGLHAFAQKLGWNEVQSLKDMPAHYKEGTLFLTAKPTMNWA
ncbi:MAG: FkbM family methyltransferase [Opitutaceae bacterium]|nr:FkbM family methyltransferase [Opitutaceae bacterium]